jgi:hypothetical protein
VEVGAAFSAVVEGMAGEEGRVHAPGLILGAGKGAAGYGLCFCEEPHVKDACRWTGTNRLICGYFQGLLLDSVFGMSYREGQGEAHTLS